MDQQNGNTEKPELREYSEVMKYSWVICLKYDERISINEKSC